MFKKLYLAAFIVFAVLLIALYKKVLDDETFKAFMVIYGICLLVIIPLNGKTNNETQ